MKKLNTLTLKEAVSKLKNKEISHAELYGDINKAVDENNKELNVYLAVDTSAQKKAEKSLDLPLAGVPIAVKDNFLTKGLTTTASSNVLKSFVPPFDSTVVAKLQDAGGVVFGKTNMDAWAHGSSTETSDFGPTKNPRNHEHLPGGSSGGSAAAVAADMCIAAIGSETAGSIRQPAAWCGVVGLKPTYGRVSRAGVVPMASSTDSPGPMGKTVEDCAILLNHIAGRDQYDGTTADVPVSDFTAKMKKGVKGMRIGMCYVDHPHLKGTDAARSVEEAAKVYEGLGATVELVGVSDTLKKGHILNPDYAIAIYTIVQRAEVSSNLAGYNGIRYDVGRSYFGDEAKRRIMLGTFTLSKGYADKYYVTAQKVRSLFIQNYKDLFETYDVLIAPTSPNYAAKLGATGDNPMYGELEDMLLEPCAIAGFPGINVPCFHNPKTNLFTGLSIMSTYWQEETMIQAAYAFEEATEWNTWRNNE
jgi:aspartyl-tRNA(Asn)/glutamyl-tRNA(Gln) amidotransferase subunit A